MPSSTATRRRTAQASISTQAPRAQPGRYRTIRRRTANRYLKRIRYGNRAPLLGQRRGSARGS